MASLCTVPSRGCPATWSEGCVLTSSCGALPRAFQSLTSAVPHPPHFLPQPAWPPGSPSTTPELLPLQGFASAVPSVGLLVPHTCTWLAPHFSCACPQKSHLQCRRLIQNVTGTAKHSPLSHFPILFSILTVCNGCATGCGYSSLPLPPGPKSW